MRPIPRKILVVRNDKLGDFVLALPSFALLKQHLPDTQICALAPTYTAELAQTVDYIDQIIIDQPNTGARQLATQLREQNFDAIITLFSTTRVGLAAHLAKIPYRLAPATKLAQLFYNDRLKQRRSRSEKPEYAYNLDLVVHYLNRLGSPAQPNLTPPYLQFNTLCVQGHKQQLLGNTNDNAFLIFIHPGSGGSAKNLSLEQYAELCHQLTPPTNTLFVISAGPGEYEQAHALAKLISSLPHLVYESKQGLSVFAEHLQIADLFISGSTGPLHIAGALDVPTAAFYPRRRSATSLRWQTLNSETKRLGFMPPETALDEEMSKINLQQAADLINQKLLTQY